MTPAPGWRKCTVYRRPGAGGMPLVLRLSEGLGRTATHEIVTLHFFLKTIIPSRKATRDFIAQESDDV